MTAPADLVDVVIERTRILASIPAPSFHESDRAQVVQAWWAADFDEVSIDAVGNVWAHVRRAPEPAVVIAAHLDTVFGADVNHDPTQRDDCLYGPSVGDDSVAVASLSALADLLPAACGNVWILATVAEEGLGNLAGITYAIENPPEPIGAIIALEGNWLGRVCVTAVGSVRYRITLSGVGGHAWEAAGIDSAVHGAARIIAALDQAALPNNARCSVNVGTITGGTAINVRADHATFDVDLRADGSDALEALDRICHSLVGDHKGELDADFHLLGRRPAGAIDSDHALPAAAVAALSNAGITAELTAASTDANAAHAAQIPAIALGITHGAQEHTVDEWIELKPIGVGLEVLAKTVLAYTRSSE